MNQVIEAPVEGASTLKTKFPLTAACWKGMKQRCKDPNKNYIAKGITVCGHWAGSFANFLSDMGPRPGRLTLDRKDNGGNYEPGNCRWADQKTQNRNQDRTLMYEYQGVVRPLAAIVEEFSVVPYRDVYNRLYKNWSLEKAITTPKIKGNAHAHKARRKSVEFEFQGEMTTYTRLAKKHGLEYQTLVARVGKYGMSLEEAINKPLRGSV